LNDTIKLPKPLSDISKFKILFAYMIEEKPTMVYEKKVSEILK